MNINKLATLRNARGGQNPDVVQWAIAIEKFGANGITVHPRPMNVTSQSRMFMLVGLIPQVMLLQLLIEMEGLQRKRVI